MKCQVALVGRQLFPVYLGVREYQPETVVFLLTKESENAVSRIVDKFPSIVFKTLVVDPYDFEQIKSITEQTIDTYGADIQLNLTGGTKVMALAANSVFEKRGLESFYYDQTGKFYSFRSRSYSPAQTLTDIKTFLHLSGHDDYSAFKLPDFTSKDLKLARDMKLLLRNGILNRLYSYTASRVNYDNLSAPYQLSYQNSILDWDGTQLEFDTGKIHKVYIHPRALEICFTGLGWELVVAEVVDKWNLKKEMLLGLELKTNDGQQLAKNEIDIVLNTGKSLIFIECKSGNVKQDDIHKMRAVKRLYGGIASKSLLVCRKKPRVDLLEKCQGLGIEVFYVSERLNAGRWVHKRLTDVNRVLSELVGKSEL